MDNKRLRGYVARHEQIRKKLIEMAQKSEGECFSVAKIAAELGMDQRTVRAHLKILEVHNAGVFVDADEKEFCTREGIALLAKKLGMKGIAEEKQE